MAPAGAHMVAPLRGARTEQLGTDAEGIEVKRGALRRLLREAVVIDGVGKNSVFDPCVIELGLL
jgi:hypothetical protein